MFFQADRLRTRVTRWCLLLKVTLSPFFLPNALSMQLEGGISISGETRATLPWYLLDSEIPSIHKNVLGFTVYIRKCLVLLPLGLPPTGHPARLSFPPCFTQWGKTRKLKIWYHSPGFEWCLNYFSSSYTHILFTQCRITAWIFAAILIPNQMLWEQSLRVSTGPCTQADEFPAPLPGAWAQQPELVSSATLNIPFSCFLSSTNFLSADLLMSHLEINHNHLSPRSHI